MARRRMSPGFFRLPAGQTPSRFFSAEKKRCLTPKKRKGSFVQIFGLATARLCWHKFLGSMSRRHYTFRLLFPARGNLALVVPRNAYGSAWVKTPGFLPRGVRAPAWVSLVGGLPPLLLRSWRTVQGGNYNPGHAYQKADTPCPPLKNVV